MKLHLLIVFAFISANALGQVVNTGLMDTTASGYKGKVTIEGYIDTYFAYDFNRPDDGNRPYFVSMNRHNEVSINVAYIDLKYASPKLRARFVPGFGSYMNANYAAEPGTLKNIIEASAGIKLSDSRSIWIDAGVFGSPYTNESAISRDHLAYTRSFAPEYVPYYLAGLKLTVPLSPKVNAYLYFLNGWQQIVDQNKNKSIGTQLEYRPNDHLLINWDTYFGNERSASDSTIGMRYFTDIYLIFNKGRWSATGCFYIGEQEQASMNATWWQANMMVRFNITKALSVTGRIENFQDDNSVQIIPISGTAGFECSSISMGLNYKLAENILVRLEGRTFFSDKDVFQREGRPVDDGNLITSNVTIWF